ncbi:hypothetical protein [Phyllobacterium sp.]
MQCAHSIQRLRTAYGSLEKMPTRDIKLKVVLAIDHWLALRIAD